MRVPTAIEALASQERLRTRRWLEIRAEGRLPALEAQGDATAGRELLDA
jgi:hypothetical protein